MQFAAALRTLNKCVIYRPAPAALFSSARQQCTSDELYCLGWDGRPLRSSLGKGDTEWRWREEEEENRETEDYRKYYEKNKPSPLSMVELVDTRKPITRAMDHVDDEKKVFLLVRETVDDALRRAEEMWWAAKVRGDPDSPQARALARMLRERYNREEHKANIAQ
ncbi:uncharacterized protein LOC110107806 [Dendrobium catenatum]|uniref:uncharacterized protein LOC110107806 n=1 Tax=Dendrobium catenatum TaxID=906689 RepID=UPI0009F63944|nr:uncharacterized protein LOC110107806 [Dendrobium catenatum]